MAEVKIKEILSRDVEIPGIVNDKMQEAYSMLGGIQKDSPAGNGSRNKYLNRHKRIYVAAAVFCITAIVAIMEWNSIYTFAKNILVKQKSYINETKLELPDISYIDGKFPEDAGCQNSKWYNSLADIEKDFGITFLKNHMADGKAHNSRGILASFGKSGFNEKYYDGRLDISVLLYITKGMKPVYGKDENIAEYYEITKDDYILLDLDITCYINSKDTYKGNIWEEKWEGDAQFEDYYKDDTVGNVIIWKDKVNGDIYAEFVYKDIQYQLSGTATTEQLKEAVAAFY